MNLSIINRFAHVYKKMGFTWREAFQLAIKESAKHDLKLIEIEKKGGVKSVRVVSSDWTKYQEATGTGRKMKEGLTLFVDLVKWVSGSNRPLISTYNYREL